MRMIDVAIIGAGPAGLAASIHAARQGLCTVVFERQSVPVDKACGEGLLPPALVELQRLGARRHLSDAECFPIRGIRYVVEDGTQAEGLLPAPFGLGVRRLALSQALAQAAREAGAEIRERCMVKHVRRFRDHVELKTASKEEWRARLLVAADGLTSTLRRRESLDGPQEQKRARFGLRQHFQKRPWSDCVEVYFSRGVEAYVTPVGAERVGVALLWEDGAIDGGAAFDRLLERFPLLTRRLAGAPVDSRVRGAGPLLRSVRRLCLHRFVLLGDAAGYIDAITGEGLGLAFRSAAALGGILPQALAAGATPSALAPYERAARAYFRRYSFFTRSVLLLAQNERARGLTLRTLARFPGLFDALLRLIAG
jgi:flavin-dependent dehydrogenase